MMTVGSLFAGVEGFGLGFQQAGFESRWQVEKESFCIAVLKTKFPDVERYYDIKDCGIGKKHKLGAVDIVTAGFPCQDLSVAGKRAGLAGTRSGLFWEVIRIVGELRPAWLVLENVPGLFSSNDGEDFACVLRELGKLGCFQSIAWTVLDSRYFGVAQRRRRVFIVCGARIGSAEQVLFEPESGEGDFAESGEERPRVAHALSSSSVSSGYRYDPNGEELIPVAHALSASAGHHGHSSPRGDGSDNLVLHHADEQREGLQGFPCESGTADHGGGTVTRKSGRRRDSDTSFTLRNPSGIGQGRNTNFVAATLNSGGNSGGFRTEPGEHIVAVDSVLQRSDPESERGNLPHAKVAADGGRSSGWSYDANNECAPTYPDRVRDFTGLPEGMDSPRYRALGNAVTVSVARYLAERIKAVADNT